MEAFFQALLLTDTARFETMDDTKRTANVKERVAQCELDVKATEEIILQQSQLIQQIKSENNDVRQDLKRFRKEIETLLSDEVAKIKEDLEYKHAFMMIQNKNLQNQVIAQKAEKAALGTQIQGLDLRITNLEVALGEEDEND